MKQTVIEAKALSVAFEQSDFLLRPMDLTLQAGEILAVIGESGSGKSTLLKALTGLSDRDAKVSGEIHVVGIDMLGSTEETLRKHRFQDFSIVFQNSKEYFNPSLSMREILYEILRKQLSGEALPARAKELMQSVGLEEDVLDQYPRELSGGMVQKFQIACAIALHPGLILLDEPTSSLDAASRSEFIALISQIRRSADTAIVVVTHDLALARDLADKILVMYMGMVCETGPVKAVLDQPRHPYTRALIHSAVELNLYKDIWGIREAEEGQVPTGCPFSSRCTQCIELCGKGIPPLVRTEDGREIACARGGIVHVMRCEHIGKAYGKKQVLKDCAVDIYGGEIVSVVGRSGSGKTTLCNIMAGFLKKDEGTVTFHEEVADYSKAYRRMGGLQFVMQDHSDSLDQRISVYQAIDEPLYLNVDHEPHTEQVRHALSAVGLETDDAFLQRKIGTLSGGQRQRVAIARGLVTEPSMLIADEPTSMLDGSSKANLLRLLKGIQSENGFSMLIVTHDLASALKISDRIYLLKDGQAVPVPRDIDPEELEKLMYDTAARG